MGRAYFCMKKKPTFDQKRPLSWSAISSFEWDPEQWYDKYVLNKQPPATQEMLFGSEIGRKIATDPKFLPQIPRYPIFEHEMRATLGGIPLLGYADGWDPSKSNLTLKYDLGEYKTGKKVWDQARADAHGQIDMYLLLLYLTEKINPAEVLCKIHWLPTRDTGDFRIEFASPFRIHTFPTKRSMVQVLNFGTRIKATHKAMLKYCKQHA